MNQAVVLGADRERGHCSALGQESHSSGRVRRKRSFKGCTARSWRWAGVSTYGCQCLYREAKK